MAFQVRFAIGGKRAQNKRLGSHLALAVVLDHQARHHRRSCVQHALAIAVVEGGLVFVEALKLVLVRLARDFPEPPES